MICSLRQALRMLFSNMIAKASAAFAQRHTAPVEGDGCVFIYGGKFDIYVPMCLVYLDTGMTDESEPVTEVREYPSDPRTEVE